MQLSIYEYYKSQQCFVNYNLTISGIENDFPRNIVYVS